MVLGICNVCKKENREIAASGKSNGMCKVCYKKELWKPKLKICLRCNRERPIHAHNLCDGCYNSVFQIQNVLKYKRKEYGISDDEYHKITKSCKVCGFDKIVDLHHIDRDHKNSRSDNLVGLCPNHHKMIHHREFQQEIYSFLAENGFKVPKTYLPDEFFKKKT